MSRGTKNSSCSRPALHTAPSTSKFMRPKSFLHSFDIAEVARGRGVFSKILAEDPGYKKGWDKDGVAKENRRHGIDREEVCSWNRPGSVRRAHAAVRLRRAVRLAVEKIFGLVARSLSGAESQGKLQAHSRGGGMRWTLRMLGPEAKNCQREGCPRPIIGSKHGGSGRCKQDDAPVKCGRRRRWWRRCRSRGSQADETSSRFVKT